MSIAWTASPKDGPAIDVASGQRGRANPAASEFGIDRPAAVMDKLNQSHWIQVDLAIGPDPQIESIPPQNPPVGTSLRQNVADYEMTCRVSRVVP